MLVECKKIDVRLTRIIKQLQAGKIFRQTISPIHKKLNINSSFLSKPLCSRIFAAKIMLCSKIIEVMA
jgi:hypothetical protein